MGETTEINEKKEYWNDGYKAGFDVGYLSAAIDGEGNTHITKGKTYETSPRYGLAISISNTNLEFLNRIRSICMGTGDIVLYRKKGACCNGVTAQKDAFYYTIPTAFVREFIDYFDLTVKKEHIEVAKRFLELTGTNKRHSKEEFDELEQLFLRMKMLNSKLGGK